MDNLGKDLVIVNLGYRHQVRKDVINVDFPFPTVDVVAKAEDCRLKITLLTVLCDNVLEHIKKPEAVVTK